MSTRSIKKPIAISQDFRLNLIVCAEFDTLIGGIIKTFSAVYKLNLVAANHQLNNAEIVRLLPIDYTPINEPRLYKAVTNFYEDYFTLPERTEQLKHC